MFHLCLLIIIPTIFVSARASVNDNYAPYGYFAFEKADLNYNKPPTVRKPPYLLSNIPCPKSNGNQYSFHDTLCGDLNKGYIPINPMLQNVHDQPYPFEVIKNKTLHFLAKALPVLKKEIKNIPKVARFSETNRNKPNSLNRVSTTQYNNQPYFTRQKREAQKSIENSKFLSDFKEEKQIKDKACEGSMKILCQLQQSLNEEGPFSKSFLNTVSSALGNAATLGNIASLVGQYSGMSSSDSTASTNKSTLSQVLNTLSTLSGTSNNYSPIISILDYLATFQNSPISNKLLTRRRKPLDAEDLFAEATSSSSSQPSTPCQSIDEYVSPTYARNYQSIWKYVVQIPSEGYFTQTIQRAKCMKSKCDYVDGGVCKESPRWVSLLVAEIFYPQVYVPLAQVAINNHIGLPNQKLHAKPLLKPTFNKPVLQPQIQMQMPSIDDFHNYHQYLLKRTGEVDTTAVPATPLENTKHEGMKPRRMQRDVSLNENTDDANTSSEPECDGYDKNGCYVIRVYYDWFLVNGNCKCWKSSGGSKGNINEVIKRIFIGK